MRSSQRVLEVVASWLVAGAAVGLAAEPEPQVPQSPASEKAAAAVKEADAEPVPPPFELTDDEEAKLAAVLAEWEQHTSTIRTFTCSFIRLRYDIWNKDDRPTESTGIICYASPDRVLMRYRGDCELCDWVQVGHTAYMVHPSMKDVSVFPLPEFDGGTAFDLQPLPFLYHVEADELRRDYWARIVPQADDDKHIRLELMPRRRSQPNLAELLSGNFFRPNGPRFPKIEILLDKERFVPYALQLHDDQIGTRSVFQFENVQINAVESGELEIAPPKRRLGWSWSDPVKDWEEAKKDGPRPWEKRFDDPIIIDAPDTPGEGEALDPPTPDEILRALGESGDGGEQHYKRMIIEPLRDVVDAPRFSPTKGTRRLHHAHYKCTLISDSGTRTVYIDHRHRCRP